MVGIRPLRYAFGRDVQSWEAGRAVENLSCFVVESVFWVKPELLREMGRVELCLLYNLLPFDEHSGNRWGVSSFVQEMNFGVTEGFCGIDEEP